MKNLFISEILLLSQKEKKARRVTFDQRRTLIHGKNHTGKSSLIKSIYKTFGAEPLMNPKFVNANIISLVKFQVENESYEIIRDGKIFGIFNEKGHLILKSSSVTNELAPFLGKLFNFTPLFQSKSGEFIIPPPAFLFLPYYIDQDISWSKSWESFKFLQQIKDYRTQSIFYHSGIRPNDYYTTRKQLEKYNQIIEETDKEQKLTEKILKDVRDKLSQVDFNIDVDSFKAEITELLIEVESLKKKEDKLKSDLHDLYHLKAIYDAQINIVKQALLESYKDLKYATEDLPQIISCPTCGAEYENSFSERFEIARDEKKSQDLLIELKKEALEVDNKIEDEKDTLQNTLSEVIRIDQILQEKRGDLKLKDIIENEGKNQVRTLFVEKNKELTQILVENAIEKDKLSSVLKSYEKKERKNEIVNFFQDVMRSFLIKLDVHSLNQDEYSSIITRIENKETGSSRPRALIAYYFTFFYLMKEYSSSAYCPLIIDSPNQQDQDIEHIDKIMEFINNNQPEKSQLILGLAETYGVDFDCKVLELTEKYSLLNEKSYNDVHDEMIDKLQLLWF